MAERRKMANMCLTGRHVDVVMTLHVLRELGWEWNSIKTFEPLEEPGQFNYFIQDVTMPNADPDAPAEWNY